MLSAIAVVAWSGLSLLRAEADEPTVWSVEQLVQEVERRSPVIRAALVGRDLIKAREVSAMAFSNPQILSDNGTAEFTYRLGVTQGFELGRVRRNLRDVVRADGTIVEAEIQLTQQEVRHEVRELYITAVVSDEEEMLLRSIAAELDRRVEQTSGTLSAANDLAGAETSDGLSTRIEARTIRVRVQRAIDAAALAHIEADIALNILLGRDADAPLHLERLDSDALPWWWSGHARDASWTGVYREVNDNLIELARAERPELRVLSGAQREADAELRLARSRIAPRLVVSLGPDLNSAPRPWMWGAFMMASLEVPIFDRQRGPKAEAVAKGRHV